MSDFTLPSGRVVPLKDEPTWGDECDADEAGFAAERENRNFGNARVTALMMSMTGLPEADIRSLRRSDFRALSAEIRKRMDPEAGEASAPFTTPSPPSS